MLPLADAADGGGGGGCLEGLLGAAFCAPDPSPPADPLGALCEAVLDAARFAAASADLALFFCALASASCKNSDAKG